MNQVPADKAADQQQRDLAIEPGRSFIVHAPAGSGKTETLTQRLLQLLGHAQRPEEIVAITFSRKAAREMRNRVMEALASAGNDDPPEADHERKTWHLARAALRQDRLQGWQVLDNPNRLNILTIDALCAEIVRRMPVTAEFGFDAGISDEPALLYREAARETLALLESGREWADDVERLLVHVDNNFQRLEGLIEGMLAKRDQWLRVIGGEGEPDDALRGTLEEGLQRLIRSHLRSVRAALPEEEIDELMELACYAAENLAKDGREGQICICENMEEIPGDDLEALPRWLGIAELLLNREGEWRRRFDVSVGFLSKSSASGIVAANRQAKKEAIGSLIGRLNASENFSELLDAVRRLPEPQYSDDQWQVLKALIRVLRLSAAQLRVVFEAHGDVDYVEKSLAALQALGEVDNPTDLALALDSRIQHLLIDEFQDTSYTQFELLRRLTAGWEPNDGRTLFVVGDPMQSIYRFREAEVGLFMAARRRGVEQLVLEPVQFNVNFRSEQGIVGWVNDTFEGILPAEEDERTGAVSFSRAEPFHPAGNGEAVRVFPFGKDEYGAEAQQVVELVREEKRVGRNVAILIRARSHLQEIVPALNDAGISYQAVEIDPLAERPAVQDLMALTRALLHTGDRVAWMALLRAPWCGLTLSDFHILIHGSATAPPPDVTPRRPIIQLMQDEVRCGLISEDGRRRIGRMRSILVPRIEARGRFSLRALVEGAWLQLGGCACYDSAAVADEADAFFALLDELDGAGDLSDPMVIEQAARALYAPPDPSAGPEVQIMTIHKAKGLQFDTVILPGLNRRPMSSRPDLLAWLELPRPEARGVDLLLAPMPPPGGTDKAYAFIRSFQRKKEEHEVRRLLYVASTRAKKRLYLMGCADFDAEKSKWKVPNGSFLNILWDALCMNFEAIGKERAEVSAAELRIDRDGQRIRRLPPDWVPPDWPVALPWKGVAEEIATALEEDTTTFWADDTPRHVGTVVHRFLQLIAETGVERWSAEEIDRNGAAIQNALRRLGAGQSIIETASERVREALLNAISDGRGRWILSGQHEDIRNEFPVSGMVGGRVLHATIDRTFADADGTRWIIDYKTDGSGGEAPPPAHRRERYRKQLEAYAELFRHLDERTIRLGLYYPASGEWDDWGV